MTDSSVSHGRFREIQYDNKFGIKDQFVINEAESLLTTLAAVEGMPAGDLGKTHLKALHSHMLGDMYEWAGSFREHDLTVGNSTGVQGAKAAHIDAKLDELVERVQQAPYSRMTRLKFSEAMAGVYTDLYKISPFPDGNARAARAFVDAIAEKHDMQIEWDKVPGQAFNVAVLQSISGKPDSLNRLMDSVTQPLDLYDLHSVKAIKTKTAQIVATAGLSDHLIPGSEITTADDVSKLAVHAKLTLVKSLNEYSMSGSSFQRDWSSTSIEHAQQRTFDQSKGTEVLKNFLGSVGEQSSGVDYKGPRM